MEPSSFITLTLVLLLIVHILLSWLKQHRHQSLPPGPTPIPLLGTPKYINLYPVTKNFQMLIQKYGSVFTIWKMSEPVIVLCGYEAMKDALVNHAEEFSARPKFPVIQVSSEGYSIVGSRWRTLRRYSLKYLRNLGMGKKSMEITVLEESKHLMQAMSDTEGKLFNPIMLLGYATVNIISSLLFREHFDYQDENLQKLLLAMFESDKERSSTLHMLCNMFPVLLKFEIIQQKVYKTDFFLNKIFTNYIDHHKETLNPESPRDFVDYYLLKIKEVENEVDPDFCYMSLIVMIKSLLGTGSVSMASTIKFSMVLVAHYPEVQAKVQQEIDKTTKSLRLPEIMDKAQLPYTNAVMHEILRVFDLAPTASPHAVTEDVVFRGYTIPKGTTVIPFLTSVLQDPSQWETPEDFNPEHFLDEEGQFRNRLAFMAFSAGKRACLGESLVRSQFFLIFTALLQKFTLTLPPGTERQDLRYLILHKKEILGSSQICAVPRSSSK
ncbi:cytochrome P450 2C7-like isoform X1 [Dendrobates tinctorius]|uniref:cytochrome P450 2C7-like isoform X1 n=1 Tax=Dendrobates tinctorius TaxID=92724 RepID=UPI003CCA0EBB